MNGLRSAEQGAQDDTTGFDTTRRKIRITSVIQCFENMERADLSSGAIVNAYRQCDLISRHPLRVRNSSAVPFFRNAHIARSLQANVAISSTFISTPLGLPCPSSLLLVTALIMDDHYWQPIWPMIQGALDYALNLMGELLWMIWRPTEDHQPMLAVQAEHKIHDLKLRQDSLSIVAVQPIVNDSLVSETENRGKD